MLSEPHPFARFVAILGRNGIEQVIELPLDDTELSGLHASIDSIRADLENL